MFSACTTDLSGCCVLNIILCYLYADNILRSVTVVREYRTQRSHARAVSLGTPENSAIQKLSIIFIIIM